jgi:hypothetical protein
MYVSMREAGFTENSFAWKSVITLFAQQQEDEDDEYPFS